MLGLVLAAALVGSTRPTHAQAGRVFKASERLGLSDLAQAVQAGAPELVGSRREVALAESDARQARLYGNPNLDAAWSTIPVGTTTPPDLSNPMAKVPNYAVGLSYTFPISKRAPRRRQADAVVAATRAELEYDVRDAALSLARVLGGLATATLRREGIAELVAGGRRATELAEARLRAQFGTPLDVDQIRIDVERTEQLLLGAESEIQAGLAACAALVGSDCESFPDAAAAHGFLERWLKLHETGHDLSTRADLRALRSYSDAAGASGDLARAARIPDPTLRAGYVHDRFIISGDQRNSLNVAVSLPLPVFDRGQVRVQAAEASRRHLLEERERRLSVAKARIPALRDRFRLSLSRCTRLDTDIIPRARAVLGSLQTAVENRLLPLTQVIQSRRILSELLIEEAESCGDAYLASLELVRETNAYEGEVP